MNKAPKCPACGLLHWRHNYHALNPEPVIFVKIQVKTTAEAGT